MVLVGDTTEEVAWALETLQKAAKKLPNKKMEKM